MRLNNAVKKMVKLAEKREDALAFRDPVPPTYPE